jgi:hypothetical protein
LVVASPSRDPGADRRGSCEPADRDGAVLADKTVKNYVSNLLAKLGMQRRSEAAAFVARVDERARHRFE